MIFTRFLFASPSDSDDEEEAPSYSSAVEGANNNADEDSNSGGEQSHPTTRSQSQRQKLKSSQTADELKHKLFTVLLCKTENSEADSSQFAAPQDSDLVDLAMFNVTPRSVHDITLACIADFSTAFSRKHLNRRSLEQVVEVS